MVGLEWQGPARQCLPTLAQLLVVERSVGEDEAAVVEGGAARQPLGGGIGADEREEGDARNRDLAIGALDPGGAEGAITVEADDLRVRPHRDLGVTLDP